MDITPTPSEIIDAFGGTAAVARLCEISDGAVSQWRRNGIPKAQLRFLRRDQPDVFVRLAANDSIKADICGSLVEPKSVVPLLEAAAPSECSPRTSTSVDGSACTKE